MSVSGAVPLVDVRISDSVSTSHEINRHLSESTCYSDRNLCAEELYSSRVPQRDSRLTLRFTQADWKNGKIVPIKVTIVELYSRADQYASSYGAAPATNYWALKSLQMDQIKALSFVDIHSKIAARNSGVLQSDRSNHSSLSRKRVRISHCEAKLSGRSGY